MKRPAVSLLVHLYSRLLRLYPSGFRETFADEMTAVFAQAMVEAAEQGGWALAAVCLRECRDLPGNLAREHWRSRSRRLVPMMTLDVKPKSSFYLSWVALSTLSVPLAFLVYWGLISIIVPWVGVRMQVGGRSVITEDHLLPYLFIPTIGLLTGLSQYLLLRRYWPQFGWWIVATSIGWVLTAAAMSLRYPLGLRLGWEFTSLWLPVLTYIISGGIAGMAQWYLLRRRLPHATWWIAATVFGWGLISITALEPFRDFAVLAIGFLPAVASGSTLWLLVKNLPSGEGENAYG